MTSTKDAFVRMAGATIRDSIVKGLEHGSIVACARSSRGIAPRFISQSPHVTFYASSNDGALNYSYTVHNYRRAGDATGGVMVLRGMDSIDASLLDTSFDNHSYFAAQRSVVSDIELMFRNGRPPSNRGLREAGTGDSKHWVFRQ